MINTNLNSQFGGGSTAIYGVDGSPTVHDMFFDHPIDGEDWSHNFNNTLWKRWCWFFCFRYNKTN